MGEAWRTGERKNVQARGVAIGNRCYMMWNNGNAGKMALRGMVKVYARR